MTGEESQQSGKSGMQVVFNENATIINMTINVSLPINPSKAYILNSSQDVLATADITAGVATFSGGYNVTKGLIYFLAVDNDSNDYSLTKSSTATGYPYTSSKMNWTAGLNHNGDNASVDTWIFSVESVYIEITDPLTPTLTLVSPENETTISDVGTNFTVSGNNISGISANWTNITYIVWADNGTLHNETTVDFTDNQTMNNTLFIDDFTLDTYIWNVEACWENATDGGCESFASNYSFDVVPTSTLDENYENITVEGSSNEFTLNISVLSGLRVANIYFNYNGTEYNAEFDEYDTEEYYAEIIQNINKVSADTNITFYWTVELESGYKTNTTLHNQTVLNLQIDDCSSYTNLLFNFTSVDESSQDQLVGATDNTSIKLDLVLFNLYNSSINFTYNKFYNQTNPAAVCLDPELNGANLRMNALVEYTASDKFVEFYNIQNYSLTNLTSAQNITLYNLEESEGQEFKITYKGEDFTPVTDVIVQIQRKYVDEGVFKTIEIPMSGTNGYTIAHLIPNDAIYNLIFIKKGVVLDSFTEVIANCQNPTITECEINLNSLITGDSLLDLIQDDEFYSSLSFDKDAMEVSSTFGFYSGVSNPVQLNVTLMDNYGNTSVCSDILNAAGGTLTCTVPSNFQNSTIYAAVSYDGEIKRDGYISLRQDPKDQYSGILMFISVILLMFIFGMGISDNPAITGVFLILGSILLIGLNLAASSSWTGGATILWFIVSVVVIIIKGGGRR